jgi:hypothetical protein
MLRCFGSRGMIFRFVLGPLPARTLSISSKSMLNRSKQRPNSERLREQALNAQHPMRSAYPAVGYSAFDVGRSMFASACDRGTYTVRGRLRRRSRDGGGLDHLWFPQRHRAEIADF